MKIDLHRIKIKDLVEKYSNDDESGEVLGYGGRLNIRPKYQREFVYKDAQRNAVIETIFKGFPLNSIYWAKNGENEFEVLDGQQRTISICEYVEGNFSVGEMYYHNLPDDEKRAFLEYELFVYVCDGAPSEKLEWFRVINIAGEKLNEQELRNAVYASEWLTDAKKKFSKRNCLAAQKGDKYLNGVSIRQEILERAIMWRMDSKKDEKICEYMAKHAKDSKNADELWAYFCQVIDWVEMKFVKPRKEMKSVEWGFLYNKYKEKPLDKDELEKEISKLYKDDEVESKKGIYEYVLSGDERHLNLRAFSESEKATMYERQGGICANKKCLKKGERFEIEQMEADHIIPWSKGGKTTLENGQMLCRECNRAKSDR